MDEPEKKEDILTKNVVNSCFQVLKAQKSLLAFPILSAFFILVFSGIYYYLLGLLKLRPDSVNLLGFTDFLQSLGLQYNLQSLVIAFIYLLVIYLINTFFQSALSVSVYKTVQKEQISVSQSLGITTGNLANIISWAFVSALIGTASRFFGQKYKKYGGQIAAALLEAGWAVLTFFVVPIISIEKLGVGEAIKRSGQVMKATWGENIVSQIKISVYFLGYFFLAVLVIVIGMFSHSTAVTVTTLVVGALAFYTISIVSSTIHSILRTVLFIYASKGLIAGGFMKESIQQAFGPGKLESNLIKI